MKSTSGRFPVDGAAKIVHLVRAPVDEGAARGEQRRWRKRRSPVVDLAGFDLGGDGLSVEAQGANPVDLGAERSHGDAMPTAPQRLERRDDRVEVPTGR
ncbi:MAG: hypothetical protein Q8L14_06030 [Myxococcales bacterium]|nr:hypothetical protein [Myxococcales bacterium]